MFSAFFESVKYSGHLLPIAFLRVYMGYFYLHQALLKYTGDYLIRPRVVAEMTESLPVYQGPEWYRGIVEHILIPHWQMVAFVICGMEFVIAISYLLGYVVRPVAFLATLMSFHYLFISTGTTEDMNKLVLATHFVMAWVGAGRCLGLDYYFFKRRRGLWW